MSVNKRDSSVRVERTVISVTEAPNGDKIVLFDSRNGYEPLTCLRF